VVAESADFEIVIGGRHGFSSSWATPRKSSRKKQKQRIC
jgi:hypothetical protein